MAVSTTTATFQCEIEKVWKTVTSLENFTWHSDLSKIEILNDKQFIEYTKEGITFVSHIIGLFGQLLLFFRKTSTYSDKLKISRCPQKAITLIGDTVQEQCQFDKYVS